jgi:hypothetical protein
MERFFTISGKASRKNSGHKVFIPSAVATSKQLLLRVVKLFSYCWNKKFGIITVL